MSRAAPLLLLACSLLVWTPGSGLSCSWSRGVHHTFLRTGGDPGDPPGPLSSPLRLYHRSGSGCVWTEDPDLIRDYASACRERVHEFTDEVPDLDPDLDLDLDRCVRLRSRSEVTRHQRVRRVKRGFIVPGTLWCGAGNKAPSYSDLGVFSATDRCCREHDQCKHTILSFSSLYGVFNSNMFTMSHCDCDHRFQRCLTEANDSISDVVGYTFFNLLKMNCFVFSHKLQCTQRNWFGMCKETKMALYADVHPPTLYESSNQGEGSGFDAVTNVTNNSVSNNISNNVTNNSVSNNVTNNSVTKDSITNNSITSATTKLLKLLNGSNTSDSTIATPSVATVTNITVVTNITASVPERRGERRHDMDNTLPTKTHAADQQLSCDAFKVLDQCRTKILPQQTRYGLHNPETRTLYHCNCTSRFLSESNQPGLNPLHSLLESHVSTSCFLLQGCTPSDTCVAVLMRAQFPPLEEQHHLEGRRRSRRRNQEVQLYQICLRRTRTRTGTGTRTGTRTRTRTRTRTPGPALHRPADRRSV